MNPLPAEGVAAHQPITLDALLAGINRQIRDYEAMNLPQTKRELEAFIGRKAATIQDYRNRHAALKDRWCRQNSDVASIHQQLLCLFPAEKWKEHLRNCYCKVQKDIDAASAEIDKRTDCCHGPNQKNRDEAKRAADRAKTALDALVANAQRLDAKLSDNQRLITEIQTLLQGQDRGIAIYVFWVLLLPAHRALMPDVLPKDCQVVGDGESPAEICCDAAADPVAKEAAAAKAAAAKAAREAPWLIDPDGYQAALDRSWSTFNTRQAAFAQAEAAYAAAPDDLDALVANRDALQAALNDRVRECLKGTAANACCPPAGAAQHS